ncbi:MAG: PrsW family intramembrane metalloprotease, partial [Clostridia bacterium]|nr:PrsW family intramembrane metalloprotease [Clostridia bacterium]
MLYLLLSPVALLAAAAIVPAILLLMEVYKYDRLEKEPSNLLGSLVLKGILATFLAIVTERIGLAVCGALFSPDSFAYNVLVMYVVVGLSEEGFKYLLLKRETWNSPYFNCRFDAVVYAVFVSLGFALWENLSYVFSYGLSTAMVR